MPPAFLIAHIAMSGLCLWAICRLTGRRAQIVAAVVLLIAVVGFVVERRSDWANIVLRIVGANLVFCSNWSLETSGVLLGLLWKTAIDAAAKRRALVLSVPLLGAALWSYAWYFAPMPQPLTGVLNQAGYCPQSTPDSCSAAAAVMLLNSYHVRTTETEMARLCLTRAGMGTPTLGLVYGLERKVQEHGLHPEFRAFASASQLAKQCYPCILSVGLKRGLPKNIEERMRGYGWEPGVRHSVVVMGADPEDAWLDVADPSFGREHWPLQDLAFIWDGQALGLTAAQLDLAK